MIDGSSVRTFFTWIAFALLAGSTACGQQWAEEMFDETSHDFGTVARGAEVSHTFTLENIYEEDAHVSDIRSTCGCTTVTIDQSFLKTWEKAKITTTVDTKAYHGQKDSTLTVVFDKPFPAEVRLQIHSYIRRDVVVHPGIVSFGSVPQGTGARKKLTVTYAGRSDWKIMQVEASNPHLGVQAAEMSRTVGEISEVKYDLIVDLAEDAPAGYIHDYLSLVTNDVNPRAARVPVPVEGLVTSAFSIRPSPLLLGVVQAGAPVSRRLVIKGAKRFRILAARCSDERFKCTVPDEANVLQLVPVTFTPDAETGKISGTISIETDQEGDEELQAEVHVQVVP